MGYELRRGEPNAAGAREVKVVRTDELSLDMKPAPLPIEMLEQAARTYGVHVSSLCKMCGNPIKVMAFKGTGVCCELCRKKRDNDFKPGEQPL